MKHIVFREFGGPEVLRLEEVPTPQPGPGQVLIRVEAAGVNFADSMQRRNVYLQQPTLHAVLGGEVAGTVEQVGEGVTSVAVGSAVVALLPANGGYAEYAVAPAQTVFPLPPGVSGPQALALQIQGLTAYLLLKSAGRVQTGRPCSSIPLPAAWAPYWCNWLKAWARGRSWPLPAPKPSWPSPVRTAPTQPLTTRLPTGPDRFGRLPTAPTRRWCWTG